MEIMENCPWCTEFDKVADYSMRLDAMYFMNRKNGRPTFVFIQDKIKGKEPQCVTVEVNYCPWCGRWLGR